MIRIIFLLVAQLLPAFCFAGEVEFLRQSADDFAHPHDLTLAPDGKFLYVSDVNNHVIRVLDPETLKDVGVLGKGELNSPHDAEFDGQGRLMVADSGNDRVVIYTISVAQNGPSAQIAGELKQGMKSPEGVTSDSSGSIYVASTANHRIMKFSNGKLVKQVGERGDGKKEFVRPHDIELGGDGYLYIGDPGNNRIQVLTTSLDYHATVSEKKRPFAEPKYLALDRANYLYIADQHNNRLRIFDDKRREVMEVSKAGSKTLNYIEGVEVVGELIWVSDTYNDRIVMFKWTR